MNFYSGDKLTGQRTPEDIRCKCGAQPKLILKMMDPIKSQTVRLFECSCGAQRWTRDKK
jgi:hypothetical protein